MGKFNCSLALEEYKESKAEVIDLVSIHYQSISNESAEGQLKNHVVKVSGHITVSF